MKLPGPDHPITIAPTTKRVRVSFAGKTIADSSRALVLDRLHLSETWVRMPQKPAPKAFGGSLPCLPCHTSLHALMGDPFMDAGAIDTVAQRR